MYRIDDETSATSMPPPEEAGQEGFFTEGDPATGVPATVVRASWLNMVQEELRSIITAGGLTPTKESNSQVLEALVAKFAHRVAIASGTPNEIIGIFNPVVSRLTNGMRVLVRAALANSSVSPTFQADETARKEIVKGNNLPLVAGDIAGEGHWLELQFDTKLNKWVLQNPAKGIAFNTGVPIGMVEYFAMPVPPPGYLKADGALVSRTTYPELFAAIGTTFGEGDGETTFNLPDLRGEFVRGWDDARGVDAGRAFGSGQGDAIRNITGNIGIQNVSGPGGFGVVGDGVFVASETRTSTTAFSSTSSGVNPTGYFDASQVVPTATENRPRNIALLACIKAFDVAVNPGLVDLTELANEMAGKLNRSEALGVDQSWQDVTSSRSAETTYTNTTNKPICVSINVISTVGGTIPFEGVLYIDGIPVSGSHDHSPNSAGYFAPVIAIVPVGSSYKLGIIASYTGIRNWSELR